MLMAFAIFDIDLGKFRKIVRGALGADEEYEGENMSRDE